MTWNAPGWRYGAAADRGRIVREAIAVLLADLDARGKDSLLARRIATANIAIANSENSENSENTKGTAAADIADGTSESAV